MASVAQKRHAQLLGSNGKERWQAALRDRCHSQVQQHKQQLLWTLRNQTAGGIQVRSLPYTSHRLWHAPASNFQ